MLFLYTAFSGYCRQLDLARTRSIIDIQRLDQPHHANSGHNRIHHFDHQTPNRFSHTMHVSGVLNRDFAEFCVAYHNYLIVLNFFDELCTDLKEQKAAAEAQGLQLEESFFQF